MSKCGFGSVRATPANSLAAYSAEISPTNGQLNSIGGGSGLGTNPQYPRECLTRRPDFRFMKSVGCSERYFCITEHDRMILSSPKV